MGSSETPIFEIKDLTIGYGSRVVMEHLDFTVRKGEIFVICGGSGCGKSTLLKHLFGLYSPISGDILFNGRSIVTADEEEKAEMVKEMGVMFQGGALFGSDTLLENVMLPMQEYTDFSPELIERAARFKLALFNLSGFEHFLPSEISGGMKKRAALSRAMALDPEVLFFDEPSAGLDPRSSATLDDTIIKLNASLGTTIIIVTHELDSIFKVAQRVLFLDVEKKTMTALDSPQKLKEDKSNEAVWNFFNRTPF
ncbi:ATP-binding cassette domain-containing protein [bacterium]|nr:ATP-binding cassette domain-containing protein [bacterium]